MHKMNEILEIKVDNEKIKKVLFYVASFMIPLIIMIIVCVYLKIYPFGEKIYMPADAHNQYSNFLHYFKRALTGQESILYYLGKSIGGDMYGLFTYYLMSPFNLITLLFDRKLIPFSFDLIIVLKLATAGLTFYYYLARRKQGKAINLVFSTLYALSGYNAANGFNIMWLDGVILLPLIIAGLEDLIENRGHALYVISLGLALIINYYIGFMICVFTGIYFLFKIFTNKLKPLKQTLKKVSRFIGYSLLACVIAAFVLIPSFFNIQGGRADFKFDPFNTDKNFEIQDFVAKFFAGTFNEEEIKNYASPPVFCGIFASQLVLLYFMNKNIKLREKIGTLIVFAIFFVSFYFKWINLLWSIGNTPAWYIYRYAFCFIFMYLITASRAFENIEEQHKNKKVTMATTIMILIAIFILIHGAKYINVSYIKLEIAMLIIYEIILMTYKSKLPKVGGRIIAIILLTLNGIDIGLDMSYSMKVIMDTTNTPNPIGIYANTIEQVEKRYDDTKEEGNGVYRVDSNMMFSPNETLLYGINGITNSTSTFSQEIYEFLRRLGYSRYHVVISSDTGNTKTMNMFLGEKYTFTKAKSEEWKGYEKIFDDVVDSYRNTRVLNLGYSVADGVTNDIEYDNPLQYQNEIMKNITGQDENIFTKHNGEITRTATETVKQDGDKFTKIETEGDDRIAKVTYEFETEQNEDAYLYIKGDNIQSISFYINGEQQVHEYFTHDNKIFYIGKHDIGEKMTIDFVLTQADNDVIFNEALVYYESDEILNKYYDILKKEQVDLQRITGRKYKGTVNIESDNKYVLMTIPYDEGWNVYVDGTRVSPKKVFGCLMAIEVGKGEHEIYFEYIPQLLPISLGFSGFGIMVFIGTVIGKRKNKENEDKLVQSD